MAFAWSKPHAAVKHREKAPECPEWTESVAANDAFGPSYCAVKSTLS